MSTSDSPGFDELVDLLRVRLGDADALNDPAIHSFKELMRDQAEHLSDQWYWNAFEDLKAQGHLDAVSHREFGGDARGRLSSEGRWYLRSDREEDSDEHQR